MNIGFDAKRALNNYSGLGNYARHLLNGLFEYFPDNSYRLYSPKVREDLFHRLQGSFEWEQPAGKFAKSFPFYWRSFQLNNLMSAQRLHIYHGLSNEIPFGARPAGVARVVTIHDLLFKQYPEHYPLFDRTVYALKTKYAIKHADHIIAVSHAVKNDIVNQYKVPDKKITVIPPIPGRKFYSQPTAAHLQLPHKYILNVGTFTARKNQLALVRAYATIQQQIPEHLVLVGAKGPALKAVTELVNKLQLQHRVHILHHVQQQDLPGVYSGATAFVFVSVNEGFGMPVTEAMLCQVPVIATGYGAVQEAAGNAALAVNPNDVEEIGSAILQVVQSPATQQKMIESGNLHVQTFTAQELTRQLTNVYEQL